MSTFLQICQDVRRECAGNGTGPSAVTGQIGEYERIVNWVIQADREIQQKHNEWRFMVGDFTIDTVASTGSYLPSAFVTPVTDLRCYKNSTLKIYLSSAGVSSERKLYYLDYDSWYRMYNTATQSDSAPIHFTVDDNLALLIAPKPNAVYRITGKYQKSITALAANSDTPTYPSEFHMLPVYLAMTKYARYTGGQETFAYGENMYNQMTREMERTQLPRIKRPWPIV